jgi:glucose/arabinose dehydrogenase
LRITGGRHARKITSPPGFQGANGNRLGRTTGLAVGSRCSLFVADDQTGTIYRICPGVRP